MNEGVAWQDTGLRANQILVMAATVLVDRAGGQVSFTDAEWKAINDRYGGHGALLLDRGPEGEHVVFLGTPESVVQAQEQPT